MPPFVPRSILYLPVTSQRFLRKVGGTGADAIVLDLEDSIPDAEKRDARAALATAIPMVSGQHAFHVMVRVNREAALLHEDIDAAVNAGCRLIALPKVTSADDVAHADRLVLAAERRFGRGEGTVAIQALVESAAGLFALRDISRASPRLLSLGFGSEDLAMELGVAPSMEAMQGPAQQVVLAAAAADLHCAGLAGSVADYSDLERFRDVALLSRRLGMQGASCIHPAQVPILNEVFGATDAEIEEARRIVEIYDGSVQAGHGACAYDGRMIDAPVAKRARALLARCARAAVDAGAS